MVLPSRSNLPFFYGRWHRRTLGGVKTPKQLSREAIDEFKAIYQAEFGALLTDDEVQEIAMRLLRFFCVLGEVAPGMPPNPSGQQGPR